jgi:hypothetical protein
MVIIIIKLAVAITASVIANTNRDYPLLKLIVYNQELFFTSSVADFKLKHKMYKGADQL